MKTITKIEPIRCSDNKKLRVAAYCRVSTSSDEQLESLEAQKKHYDSYIKEHDDWEYAGLYYDEGITGTKKECRAGLLEMLNDCRLSKIDFILTKSISRFSRNKIDCLTMVRELLRLGIGIFFEKENINTKTMNDEFLLTVLSSIAETESRSISSNVKWGVQKRMREGTYKQATPAYGYTFNKDKQYEIDEEKAKVVRLIYNSTLNGVGEYKLAKELNEKDIPSPKGGTWNSSIISDILTNERYCGDCLFGKTYSDSDFKRHENHGESERILIENHHEPIISRDQFEKVQDLRAQRRRERNIERNTNKYRVHHTFTRKLKCGYCGHYLKHRTIKSRVSKPYEIWVCETHNNNKDACDLKPISQEAIENSFTTMINKLIFSKKKIIEPFVREIKSRKPSTSEYRIKEIEKELDENARRKQAISELAAQSVLDAKYFLNAKAELKSKRQELINEKEILKANLKNGSNEIDEAKKLERLISQLKISDQFDKELFLQIVDYIVFHSRDQAEFHLKCGLVFTEKVNFK